MRHIKKFLESINLSDIDELKEIISQLPNMRWNISEKDESEEFPYIYFGDEWDNWEHMTEDERAEYFGRIWSIVKKLKDKIEKL